jgi:hypothetical protein
MPAWAGYVALTYEAMTWSSSAGARERTRSRAAWS